MIVPVGRLLPEDVDAYVRHAITSEFLGALVKMSQSVPIGLIHVGAQGLRAVVRSILQRHARVNTTEDGFRSRQAGARGGLMRDKSTGDRLHDRTQHRLSGEG